MLSTYKPVVPFRYFVIGKRSFLLDDSNYKRFSVQMSKIVVASSVARHPQTGVSLDGEIVVKFVHSNMSCDTLLSSKWVS